MSKESQRLSSPQAAPGRADFEKRLGQRALVLWLTGLSGSGKSTLGDALAGHLHAHGAYVARLDGDALREGLCADLGFSPEAREENLRRFAHVAKLMLRQGLLVIVSTISPLKRHRKVMREILAAEDLVHVHMDTPLERCEARDPKGLYQRARAGEIPSFTGVSAPYERPEDADLQLDTGGSVQDSLQALLAYLAETDRLCGPAAGLAADPDLG